ncbi:Phosphatidylglycerol/phosphatidylinositol transfer protein [Ceratobasidium sp. 395]|nr:Phosphatidylglycerol/phosphatidylinositol transfer protein [Ceratobasidium sp. 395]
MLARTPSLVSAAFALSSAVSALLVPGKLIDQVRVGGNDVHATNSWTYTDCGLPTDAVQVHSIKVSPDPPQIGKDLTITASGYVGQKIEKWGALLGAFDWLAPYSYSDPHLLVDPLILPKVLLRVLNLSWQDGAYADVTVKLGLIKLLHKQFDVCEEARNNNVTVQCPVEPGEYVVMQTVTLPKETPKAKFAIDIKGFTSEEALDPDLVCLQLRVDFLGRPWLTI